MLSPIHAMNDMKSTLRYHDYVEEIISLVYYKRRLLIPLILKLRLNVVINKDLKDLFTSKYTPPLPH